MYPHMDKWVSHIIPQKKVPKPRDSAHACVLSVGVLGFVACLLPHYVIPDPYHSCTRLLPVNKASERNIGTQQLNLTAGKPLCLLPHLFSMRATCAVATQLQAHSITTQHNTTHRSIFTLAHSQFEMILHPVCVTY